MENNRPLLSICIPTYNRKNRLVKELQSIFSQRESSEIEVVICDNASNYSVRETINSFLTKNELSRVRIINNKLNIGGDANIASLFLHCETPWVWILGDDDETTVNSISTILLNINRYPNTTLFKYSIKGFKSHSYKECCTIKEVVDYYIEGGYKSGDFIFMSNNVYNMDHVSKYYGETLLQCGCRIPHLLPAFYSLGAKNGCVRMMPDVVVEYQKPEVDSGWNFLDVAIDLTKVELLRLNISNVDRRRLCHFIFENFPHKVIVSSCLSLSDKQYSRFIYNTIYRVAYSHSGHYQDKIYWMIFHFSSVFNIKITALRRAKGFFKKIM